MTYHDMKEPWAPGRVIMGSMVTDSTVANGDVYFELSDKGCRNDIALRLIMSARMASMAINKMMEKTI